MRRHVWLVQGGRVQHGVGAAHACAGEDVAYAPHLAYLVEGGFDFSDTPRVRDWLERLLARAAWQQAHALIFDYD